MTLQNVQLLITLNVLRLMFCILTKAFAYDCLYILWCDSVIHGHPRLAWKIVFLYSTLFSVE